MGVPMAGMMMPTLDVSEIDKRITDMRAVENWLNMNLSLLRMAIQGLEMQKAALDAMKGAEQAMGEQATHPAMEAWLNALQGKSSPPDPSKEK